MVVRGSLFKKPTAKRPKKATGQIEMLLPIAGKKLVKEVSAK
jgi:hypothetical protein